MRNYQKLYWLCRDISCTQFYIWQVVLVSILLLLLFTQGLAVAVQEDIGVTGQSISEMGQAIHNRQKDMVTVTPSTSDGVLINPGKGWVLYGLPTYKTPEVLALGTIGYARLEWADLEPEEGKYDWRVLDYYITEWAKAGKQFSFGVMCANSHSPRQYTTPKWVFDAGAKGRSVNLKDLGPYDGTPGEKMVPVFDDPVFMAKLRALVTAMGERYDGNTHLAYVDMRSYGNWGEGHMWPFKGDPISSESFKEHISIYTEAFHKTQLILPWGEKLFNPVYDWAVKQGIGIRRDGICGNSDGSETFRALGYSPGVFEFFGSYEFLKKTGGWDGKVQDGWGYPLTDCVEKGHPSYISMSQWGNESQIFLEAERPLIERLANRMGYHYILKEAKFPATWQRGNPATVNFQWQNQGVAPVYVPCVVALALLDESGGLVDVCYPADCHPHRWLEGITEEKAIVQFDRIKSGSNMFPLAIGLVKQVGDREPAFRLGIDIKQVNGWYVLGEVAID